MRLFVFILMLPFVRPSGLDLGPSTLWKRFKFFDVGAAKIRGCRVLSGRKTFKFDGIEESQLDVARRSAEYFKCAFSNDDRAVRREELLQ